MPNFQLNFSKPVALQFARAKAARIADNLAAFTESEAKLMIDELFPPASPSGEPPHKRTGRLQDSVTTEAVDTEDTFQRFVGTDRSLPRPYGRYLEYGFDLLGNSENHVPERPWLRPTFDKLRQEWKKHI